MATKVDSKSCLPEYYVVNHLNEERNGNWCWYYQDKTIDEQVYSKCIERQANGYSEYEKEMLKHKMLEHETTFRKQVYELHRLYRTQKELMVECQSRNVCRSSLPPFTSTSSNQSEFSWPIWKSSHVSIGNYCYGKESVVGSKNVKIKKGFLDGDSSQSHSMKRNVLVENNAKRHCRRMFDLHLPADSYIDLEDDETSGNNNIIDLARTVPVSRQEKNISLTMSNTKGVRENGWLPELRAGNCLKTESVTNSEVMTTKLYDGGRSEESAFVQILGSRPNNDMLQGFQLSMRSATNSEYQHGGDKWTTSNFSHRDERARKECLFFHNESVRNVKTTDLFSEAHCHDKISTSSEPIQPKLEKTYDIHSIGADKLESNFRRMSNGYKASTTTSHLTNSNCSSSISPSVLSSFSALTKPVNSMRRSNAVQEHVTNPFKFTSMPLQTYVGLEQWQSGNSNVYPGAAGDASKLGSVSGYGILAHGPSDVNKDLKLKNLDIDKKINLNEAISSTDAESEVTANKDLAMCFDNKQLPRRSAWHIKQECSNEPFGSSMFPAFDLNFSIDQCQLTSNSEAVALQPERKENSLLQINRASNHESKYTDGHMNKFPGEELLFAATRKCEEKDGVGSADSNSDFKMFSSKKEIAVGGLIAETCASEKSKELRCHINLNLEADLTDDEMTPENKVAELPGSSESFGTKSNHGIDSEAANYQSVCHTSDTSSEIGFLAEILVRMGAGNIVNMSMDHNNLPGKIEDHMFPSSCDALQWFADFAITNSEKPDMPDKLECSKSSLPGDDMDLFEAMTLQLEVIPVAEYSCTPKELVNNPIDDDDIGVASLLFTKPRRVQARRRRQRRDFQKDILPSLASLSRVEVSEDLHLIGELMKASGSPWQSRISRRCPGRKGAGKRQLKDSTDAVSLSDIQLSSDHPPARQTNTELEVTASTIVGWGRTTRRCRRQRTLPSNLVTPSATTIS